jgi:hypothetical protein
MHIVRTLIVVLVLAALPDAAARAYPATVIATLNVRSGPCACRPVVARLRAGDAVEVWATRGGWVRISDYGWVNVRYLDGGRRDYTIYQPEDFSLPPGSPYAPYGFAYGGPFGYAGYSQPAYLYPYPPAYVVWRTGGGWYGRPRAASYGVRAQTRW